VHDAEAAAGCGTQEDGPKTGSQSELSFKFIIRGHSRMKSALFAAVCAGSMVLMSGSVFAGEDAKVAAEVMAAARAQWAAGVQGKSVSEQMTTVADDYTEFNPDFPVRLDGKALNAGIYEALSRNGDKPLSGEMVNPKVQVYGDVAILSYNYVGVDMDKDGKTSSSAAKSTRVYAKQGGKWMLVHANFAPVASAD
jgi:ketosteroid isomerase-like protein